MAITTTAQRATLFDPKTGQRSAVDVGSRQAADLFSKGYQLEQSYDPVAKRSLAATGIANPSQTALPSSYATDRAAQERDFTDLSPVGVVGTPGSFMQGTPRNLPPYMTGQPGATPTGQPSQTQGASNPAGSFQSAITTLLQQAQGKGGDSDLLDQRNKLIAARFNASNDITPENLRVLAPGQQSALRGMDQRALEQQLGGVSTALQTREKERGAAMDLVNAANEALAASNKESKPIEIGGSLVQLNPQTGQYEVVYQGQTEKKYAPGVIGEFQFAQENGYEGSFNDYQNLDANRKLALTKGGSSGGGTRSGGGGGAVFSGTPTGKLSARAQQVFDNPSLLANYTPTIKGQILDEFARNSVNFDPAGLEKLNAGQREQIDAYDTLTRNAQLAKTYLDTGLKTGAIESRLGAAGALIGKSKEFTEYRSALDNMGSILIKARSGAAVTPQEFERIKGFIPGVNDDEKTAATKMAKFFTEIEAARKNYITRSTQTTQQIINSASQPTASSAAPTDLRTKYGY